MTTRKEALRKAVDTRINGADLLAASKKKLLYDSGKSNGKGAFPLLTSVSKFNKEGETEIRLDEVNKQRALRRDFDQPPVEAGSSEAATAGLTPQQLYEHRNADSRRLKAAARMRAKRALHKDEMRPKQRMAEERYRVKNRADLRMKALVRSGAKFLKEHEESPNADLAFSQRRTRIVPLRKPDEYIDEDSRDYDVDEFLIRSRPMGSISNAFNQPVAGPMATRMSLASRPPSRCRTDKRGPLEMLLNPIHTPTTTQSAESTQMPTQRSAASTHLGNSSHPANLYQRDGGMHTYQDMPYHFSENASALYRQAPYRLEGWGVHAQGQSRTPAPADGASFFNNAFSEQRDTSPRLSPPPFDGFGDPSPAEFGQGQNPFDFEDASPPPSPSGGSPRYLQTQTRHQEILDDAPSFFTAALPIGSLTEDVNVASGREPESHASRNPYHTIIPRSDKPGRKRGKKAKTQAQLGDMALTTSSYRVSVRKEEDEQVREINAYLYEQFDHPASTRVQKRVIQPLIKTKRAVNTYNAYNSYASTALVRSGNKKYLRLNGPEKRKFVANIAVLMARKAEGDAVGSEDEDGDEIDWDSLGEIPSKETAINLIDAHRATQETGVRVNNKAAALDMYQTGNRVENELLTCEMRTGMRSLTLLSPGHDSDTGLPRIITAGKVEGFCQEVLKMSSSTLLARFEAYSKLKGSQPKEKMAKADMVSLISKLLCQNISSVTSGTHSPSQIEYKDHELMAVKYKVEMVGWPKHIVFVAPSSLDTHHLREILDLIQAGTLHFQRVPRDKLKKIMTERSKQAAAKKRSQPDADATGGDERPAKRKRKQSTKASSTTAKGADGRKSTKRRNGGT